MTPHNDRARVLLAILAALVVCAFMPGVARGLAGLETGEAVLMEGDERG